MGCICTKETVVINNRKYTIRELLGEGGFSTVFLVEDNSSRKKYALKKIICHSLEDEVIANKEVEYLKMCRHPNIIQCIDSAHEGIADPVVNSTSKILILLPYYHRGTLADEIERRRGQNTNQYFDQIDVLTIFEQICEGVKALHGAEPEPLAHRDLKTANILLDDEMTPIIMDLGSVAPAKVKVCGQQEAQNLQDTAAERCSMLYKAPELFNVESYCTIDERTDIWSLGCILYAMCYLKSPFEEVYEKGNSVALAVMSPRIKFPENTPYNERIENLILKMLKVNPEERIDINNLLQCVKCAISNAEERL